MYMAEIATAVNPLRLDATYERYGKRFLAVVEYNAKFRKFAEIERAESFRETGLDIVPSIVPADFRLANVSINFSF
jgi:hypothetical protein